MGEVAVPTVLGLGTIVGWKRIVVIVREKIARDHLTYAQGAEAEITAMLTIGGQMGSGCRCDVGRGADHGGESFGVAVGDDAQPDDRPSADAAGGSVVLGVPVHFLNTSVDGDLPLLAKCAGNGAPWLSNHSSWQGADTDDKGVQNNAR